MIKDLNLLNTKYIHKLTRIKMFNKFLNLHFDKEKQNFQSPDSEKLFKKNLKRQPDDWIYRNKKVEYQNNESGFRTKSLDKIDWENSIVVFGCSFTYGIGLAEEDTFCHLLEKKLNIPVINLGIPGSAIDINHFNSIVLHENFPLPKAIVHCWTSLYRYSDFRKDGIKSHLPAFVYYPGINWAEKSKFYVHTDRILWKNKTIYKEYSFFGETFNSLQIPSLQMADYARDLAHPGIRSNLKAADKIYKDLKNEGI
jgi:hypothetical protein